MASDNSNETCWHLTDVVAQLIYSLTVLLFMTFLLSLNPFDVAYDHQIAFEQRKSTGTVYTGPDFKFNAFQADAQPIECTLQDLDNATSDKLNIKIKANLQDVLGEEGLEHLHKRFNRGYNPIVKNTAKTARKKDFTTEQEQALFQSVQRELGGICCRKDYSK